MKKLGKRLTRVTSEIVQIQSEFEDILNEAQSEIDVDTLENILGSLEVALDSLGDA